LPSLRALLEAPWALPADVAVDGTVLVRANLPGVFQLYLAPADGGELVQLTDLPEPVTGQFVSGTGRILLEMDEGGNERAQLYLLDPEPGAPLEPLVVESDFLHLSPRLSRDGSLLAYACNRRNGRDLDVYVRALATGEERCAFALGGYCTVAGFSPDGRWLGVVRATDRTGDNDLHLVDLEHGESFLVAPEEEDAFFGEPAWLPDSRAFLLATNAGRDMVGIARFEIETRALNYCLEDAWDLDCSIDWAGRVLLVETNEEGASRLELRDPLTLTRRHTLALPAHGVVDSAVFSADGRWLAYGFSSSRMPWGVWLVDTDTGEQRPVTQLTSAVDEDELAEPTVRRYPSFDGESVPVFLFEPSREVPTPVVIEIHGGPDSQRRPVWNPLVQHLVSQGFAVVQPNVRGSTGYGKRYEHLDDRERRLDSVLDIVALHEWLAQDDRFDASRVVLYGGSYGGYMVLAGLAFHPERWVAGIGVVALSSLVTFLENTSEWRRSSREREYGSLEHDRDFLAEASPLTHLEAIRAPLFLIHGANDPRVPLSEAEQIHRALRERGVRCELLVYDDEGHGLNRLENRLDAYPKAVAFLEEVLGAGAAVRRRGTARSGDSMYAEMVDDVKEV